MPFELPDSFAPTRVIAVVLSEEDWRAFRAIEPQPVEWVHRQIRERLANEAPVAAQAGPTAQLPLET